MKDSEAGPKREYSATSHLAALNVELLGKADSQRRRIYDFVKLQGGLTSFEIDKHLGFSREVAHRRLPELRDAGFLKAGPERVCTVRGSVCVTWFPADPPKPAEPKQEELF